MKSLLHMHVCQITKAHAHLPYMALGVSKQMTKRTRCGVVGETIKVLIRLCTQVHDSDVNTGIGKMSHISDLNVGGLLHEPEHALFAR